MENVEKFSKAYTKYQMTLSFKDTIYRSIWGIVVYAITAFLLYKVSNGSLDIEIYLIIVPYLSTATSKLNELWDKDFNNIKRLCDVLGILKNIELLPDGFDTNIVDVDDSSILFMIGLARALLSNCKILMVYELPDDMDTRYRKNIAHLISTQNINKTIILFTHSNAYDKYASRIFSVVQGKVNQIK